MANDALNEDWGDEVLTSAARAKRSVAPQKQLKPWGKMLLRVLSITMLLAAGIVSIFLIVRINQLSALESTDAGVSTLFGLYGLGLFLSLPVIIPAVCGIIVSFKPKLNILSIALGVLALVLIVAFAIYSFVVVHGAVFGVMLYVVLGAIVPVFYLIASLQIRRCCKASASDRGKHSA